MNEAGVPVPFDEAKLRHLAERTISDAEMLKAGQAAYALDANGQAYLNVAEDETKRLNEEHRQAVLREPLRVITFPDFPVPPDGEPSGPVPVGGEGLRERPEIVKRSELFKALLAEMQVDYIEANSSADLSGTMRMKHYKIFLIPSLKKMVEVNDDYAQTTIIFHDVDSDSDEWPKLRALSKRKVRALDSAKWDMIDFRLITPEIWKERVRRVLMSPTGTGDEWLSLLALARAAGLRRPIIHKFIPELKQVYPDLVQSESVPSQGKQPPQTLYKFHRDLLPLLQAESRARAEWVSPFALAQQITKENSTRETPVAFDVVQEYVTQALRELQAPLVNSEIDLGTTPAGKELLSAAATQHGAVDPLTQLIFPISNHFKKVGEHGELSPELQRHIRHLIQPRIDRLKTAELPPVGWVTAFELLPRIASAGTYFRAGNTERRRDSYVIKRFRQSLQPKLQEGVDYGYYKKGHSNRVLFFSPSTQEKIIAMFKQVKLKRH